MSSSKKAVLGGDGDSTSVTRTSKAVGFLLKACGSAVAGSYGLFVYSVLLLTAYTSNRKFSYMSANDRRAVQLARRRLWDLQGTPWSLLHKFIEIHGVTLHYVLHTPEEEVKGSSPLVIFIHGFPGSSLRVHVCLY
jgi:dipeptidyl aminopeptidase/acylaminoacyl peptidase